MQKHVQKHVQNRATLVTLRAAAVVIIATGLNDVISSAVPRYEPLYLYLAAIGLVALLDGVILGLLAAAFSFGFYALLFTPRPDLLTARMAVPAAAMAGVAVVAGLIRGLSRARRRRDEPVTVRPAMPPLLETSPVAHAADNAEVLAAIDELRAELRAAVAELSTARARENELQERTRSDRAEREMVEMRMRQIEEERDWALETAQEERARRDAVTRELAESREESASMAGRLAELELSAHESERALAAARAEAERRAAEERGRAETAMANLERTLTAERSTGAALKGRVVEAEARVEEERAHGAGLAARIAELEATLAAARESGQRVGEDAAQAIAERDEARAEVATLQARIDALQASHAAERATRERLEANAAQFDAKQQALADRVAAQRDEARAEAASHQARVAELESSLATERATRERLEGEVVQFDAKLQTIVTHLASDHETDLGQALSDKEEARAEARALSMKLATMQRKLDDAEALLAETRQAAQAEIDRLRAQLVRVPPKPSARPRVLVVHPDADVRAAAGASLERAGYEVVGAADGLEALRVAIAEQPEVVIAESSMPKMDGRELCQLLKSQGKTAHIRFVLLMRAGDTAPTGALVPDEVLRKPVPVETLRGTLANLLASSRQ